MEKMKLKVGAPIYALCLNRHSESIFTSDILFLSELLRSVLLQASSIRNRLITILSWLSRSPQ